MESRTTMARWVSVLTIAWVCVGLIGAERIKLATLAQTGTSYHKSLLNLRDQWRRVSNGQIDLIIYADGRLGGESKTVSLLNLGAIDAAVLTAVGLTEIERGVNGLQSLPMGFNSLNEVDSLGKVLHPILEERFLKKGYVVLFWADAGWVKFFSTQAVKYPEDLKRLKLFTWAGDPQTVTLYKTHGFNVVPLETSEIVTALQTGMIEAVPCPPVFALTTQIDKRARYMLNINWAPLVGAMIIKVEVWERLPIQIRPELKSIAERIGQEVKQNGRNEAEEAIRAMQRRGLTVIDLEPSVKELWRTEARKAYPKLRGTIIPEDIFDMTIKVLDELQSTSK